MASRLTMSIILSQDLVTSESKATFNPHCGFSINEASKFSKEASILFNQQYGCSLKTPLTKSYRQITIHNVLCCHRQCIYMLLFGSGLTLNSIIDVQKAGSLLALRSFITLQNLFVSVVNSIVTGQILLMYFKG